MSMQTQQRFGRAPREGHSTPVLELEDSPPKLGAQLAEKMQREILSEGLAVGHRMGAEPDLMAKYRVSRSTLREAIRQLEAHGAIQMRRGGGGGLIVAEPPAQSAVRLLTTYLEIIDAAWDELFEARIALEVTTAGLAARRADEAQIARLRALADRLREVGPRLDEVATHVAIRDLLGEMSGNPALALFVQAFNRFTLEAVASQVGGDRFEDSFVEATAAKRRIVDAIVARNDAAAQSAAREDLDNRREVLRDMQEKSAAAEGDGSGEAAAGSPRRLGYEVKMGQTLAIRIAHEILRQGKPVGSKLGAEPDLLSRYRVSRAVFRESVRILESHGLVQARRGYQGGVIVGRPNPDYTVRTAAAYLQHLRLDPASLEEVRAPAAVVAARLAARRGSPADCERLKHLLDVQLAAEGGANTEAAAQVQIQIGEMSGNRALALIMRVVIATNWRSPHRPLPNPEFGQLQESHKALVAAVIAGDEPLAEGRMVQHVRNVRRWLVAVNAGSGPSAAAPVSIDQGEQA